MTNPFPYSTNPTGLALHITGKLIEKPYGNKGNNHTSKDKKEVFRKDEEAEK
ncbi:MAG: hypothetical protein Q4A21_02545 [bacterium]|nr:hypothetical protein [bacterium]